MIFPSNNFQPNSMILGRDMISIQDHEVTSEDETEMWRKRQKDVM